MLDALTDPNIDTYRAPNGAEITGLFEVVWARAHGTFDDSGEFAHEGGSTILWDEQKPVQRGGQNVYLDDSGNEWLESQIVKPGQALPATIASPYDDAKFVAACLEASIAEAMTTIFADQGGKLPNGSRAQAIAASARGIVAAVMATRIRNAG